jgi:hypothetical protein
VSNVKRTINYAASDKFSLAVTSPSQDSTASNSYITLTGKVSDALSNVTVNITMDGKSYAPAVINGVFQQRLTFTTAKLYTITVKAKDQAGNSSTVTRNVIYRPIQVGTDD